jgi:hypothetical protein
MKVNCFIMIDNLVLNKYRLFNIKQPKLASVIIGDNEIEVKPLNKNQFSFSKEHNIQIKN